MPSWNSQEPKTRDAMWVLHPHIRSKCNASSSFASPPPRPGAGSRAGVGLAIRSFSCSSRCLYQGPIYLTTSNSSTPSLPRSTRKRRAGCSDSIRSKGVSERTTSCRQKTIFFMRLLLSRVPHESRANSAYRLSGSHAVRFAVGGWGVRSWALRSR